MAQSEFLKTAPERFMGEAMRMNVKLPWRPKEYRDATNVHCLLGETEAVSRTSQRMWPCVQ